MIKYFVLGLALAALFLPSPGYTEFDREQCYGKCRGVPLRFGHLEEEATPCHLAQANYDACMQECERKFWAEFEEKTRSLQEK
jgi:hypothetical protein